MNDDGPMTLTDVQLQAFALRLWANIVETGSPAMSADDALEQKKTVRISRDGMRLSVRLRDLADSLDGR